MKQVVFIDSQNDHHWIETLRQAVTELGRSLVFLDWRQMATLSCWNYDLTILDASTDVDLISIIGCILTCNPLARIVVISSAPHWKQARETLLAGATDYVKKEDDRSAVLGVLERNLAKMRSKPCPARFC